MADSDQVQVTLRVQNAGVQRLGFGKALIPSHNASFPDRTREYTSYAAVIDDGFAADSPEALAVAALFAQSPAPTSVVIGKCDSDITQAYAIGVAAVRGGFTYAIDVAGEGVTPTAIAVTTFDADITFTADNTTEECHAVAHGMATGDGPFRVSNAGGGLPAGLAADTNYWIIAIDADNFQLATSKANAIALTPIDITSNGTGVQTLRRVQNDVICAQLVQALNGVTGKNFTAAQVPGAGETDTILVTGDGANDWFSLAVRDVTALSIAQTHSADDLEDDLVAIKLVDDSWYWVCPLYPSKAYLLAAAAFVEANSKAMIARSSDTAPITTAYSHGVSTDVLAALFELGYKRTEYGYHHIPAQFAGAALTGRLAPLNPGAWTAKFKSLSGVSPSPLTATHRANLIARRANGYMVEMGRPITFEGTVANQDFGFLDVTVGLDAFVDDLRKSIFGVQVALDKIAYDDGDIAIIEGAARGSAKRYSSEERPVLRNDPAPTVTVPKVADVSPSDRALRVLPDVTVHGELAGAVHKVLVTVTVTP